MKFENTETFNFIAAFRGMRNPKNSWERGDTETNENNELIIGPNDMKLARALIEGGSEHRKFLRQIFVSVDITAPLYWWKEMDTYKIGTTANSTSTMHKLTSKPITLDCFECGDLDSGIIDYKIIVDMCEDLRQRYLETNEKRYWKELVRWLPNGWLQTRTWTANYEVLRSIYHQRANHKLVEWKTFREWVETLPYAQELIIA